MSVGFTAVQRLGWLGALVSLALACSGGDPAPDLAEAPANASSETAKASRETAKASNEATAGAAARRRAVGGQAVPEGRVRVTAMRGRVSVRGNGAPIHRVLRRLARTEIFDLEVGEIDPKKITVDLVSVPMSEVLDHVLAGIPYSADYEVTRTGGHRLVWLSVGVFADPEAAETSDSDASSNTREAAREAKKDGRAAKRRAYLAERAQRFEDLGGWDAWQERQDAEREWQRELVEKLESDDPEERVAAISQLDPSGAVAERIAEVAVSDVSIEVRLEAVRALTDADNYAGAQGLMAAMSDPAPEVVIEALKGAEWYDDSTMIPYLEPAMQHPDAGVRAQWAITRDSISDD